MDTIVKLLKSKTSLKGSITRIETFCEKATGDTTRTEYEVKLKKIDQLQIKVDELKQCSFGLEKVSETELNEIDTDLENCELRLEELEVRIKTLLNNIDSNNKKNVSVIDDVDKKETLINQTKIPPVVLPTFSGKYEQFSSFKNQFDDLITSNDQLSQSQKLYYLNSCLVDEVKEFASSFDTFSSLYEALESRYDNKRLIVDIHIQSILNFKKIESEDAYEIREMIDCIKKNLRALKMLKYEQNDLFDIFLLNIMLKKLDKESRKNFEILQKNKEVPTFEQFITFLEQRETVLMSVDRNCDVKSMKKKPFNFIPKSKTLLLNENDKFKKCIICFDKSPHPIFRCSKFLQLSPEKRFDLVKLHKLCEICLYKGHKKNVCNSKYICTCGGRHSKSICFKQQINCFVKQEDRQEVSKHPDDLDSPQIKYQNKNPSQENDSAALLSKNTVLNSVIKSQNKKSVILSTGYIFLKGKDNKLYKCKTIFDSASNVNLLTKQMCDRLGIKLQNIQTSVSGLNSTKQNLKGKLSTFISNEEGSFIEPIEFCITDKITGSTPHVTLDISKIKIPKNLNLADPCFFEAEEIDALLNADIFYRTMKGNIYRVNEELVFIESQFGWIAGGKLNETKNVRENKTCFLLQNEASVEDTMKLFFDLESLGIKDDPCFREDDQAMAIFKQTVRYDENRYIVELPFRKDWKQLSDNLPIAKQRFNNLWRRFQRDSELYSQYLEIIRDYLKQGIIERVENLEIDEDKPLYYLPHQAVIKQGRVTTSTRIVFDATSHQTNELSLNDCLWQGPNLYPNLLDVLINFRLNRIAIISDIRQAFLQICLADKHKDVVRFLWSDSNPQIDKKPNLQVYHFNRVVFGVNASPFLLAATIKYHIDKYKNEFPKTVKHLDSFMYVDDWITGEDTWEDSLIISRCAKNIMKEAGMEMRKWISNDPMLMKQWAAEGFEIFPVEDSVSLGTNNTKVLGMAWQTQEDSITVDTKSLLEFISESESTKRFLLQTIGKIYDPLGLLTPFTIRMKCLIQELWEKKISWDEPLPSKIKEKWLDWCKELPLLNELRIPRLVLDSDNKDIVEIHVFCDASKLAYGASVYIKVKKKDKICVNLLTSKSRVAPLKSVTLPRLELLGALVAARLSSKVREIIGQKVAYTVFHWTDSKIVLFWIKGSIKRWKQFVANRVGEITRLTDSDTWYHCAGKDNSSDLLSRGISAESLLHEEKWWCGPSFLRTDEPLKTDDKWTMPSEDDYWAELNTKNSDNEFVSLTLNYENAIFYYLIDHYYKFLTIVRILSYIFRFVNNCRNVLKRRHGPLGSDEIAKSELFLVKKLQKEQFHDEMSSLKRGSTISSKSKILNLSPFLDKEGVMRVGGRLENSQLSYASKHPILLPSKGKLTEIIVKYYHEKFFHLGPQHLLFQVRQKYWPVHGRNICKKIVHNCITCFREKPKKCSQKMGDLPTERITPDKTFSSCGIDLCGAFMIKNKYQRKGPEIKVYVCIFICLVTKAIHLEIISDLTSQALISTLKRFIARRGHCCKLFSDNGTNMVGANRELKTLFKLVREKDESLFAFLAEENIEWNFIPPRSPNWGGLWEANIKAFKYHFKRVAGNSKFTYEELLTLVTQIEAILNSRPLTPLTSDIDDLEVLTPAHFLIGRPITAIVEPSLTGIETNRLKNWQRITKSVQTIWKRWSLSYLNGLQQRKKWVIDKKNLKIGDMVLIREENLPPCKWLLGRITAIYPGQDGKVRVVDVKTVRGIFKRSISKLSLLPIEN